MAHPYHHALSSQKSWGGAVEDTLSIHDWFDASKMILADFRHRALRHHAEGIFMAETIFGQTITLSSGRIIPVRWIGEQHVREDLGRIPSFADWARAIRQHQIRYIRQASGTAHPGFWPDRTGPIGETRDAPEILAHMLFADPANRNNAAR